MANTYISFYVHVIFSTKHREPYITNDIQDRLWSYLGGIAKEHASGLKKAIIDKSAKLFNFGDVMFVLAKK